MVHLTVRPTYKSRVIPSVAVAPTPTVPRDMEAVGLFLACADAAVQILKSVKRRVDANKRLKGLVSEAIALVRDMENTVSLLFDTSNTTVSFAHVFKTSLQEFELIKAELAQLRRKLANDSCLKRFIRAPASAEQLESIVRRLATLKRHVELCAMTAESQAPAHRRHSGSSASSSYSSHSSRSSSASSRRKLQMVTPEKVRVGLPPMMPQLATRAIPPYLLRQPVVRRSKSVPYNVPR